MSTDNTPEGLREAVEARRAEFDRAAAMEFPDDPHDTYRRMAYQNAAAALGAILAEHPATPAEVEPTCEHGVTVSDLCVENDRLVGEISARDRATEPDAEDADGLSEAEREALVDGICRGHNDPETWHGICKKSADRVVPAVERILATRTRMAAEAASQEAWKVAAQRRDEARRFYLAWQVARIRAAAWRRAAEAGEKRGAEKAAERIAQAIEAEALADTTTANQRAAYRSAARIARADREARES